MERRLPWQSFIRRKLLPVPPGGRDVRLYGAPAERLLSAAMSVERAWLR
jgi:hypothetical protein